MFKRSTTDKRYLAMTHPYLLSTVRRGAKR
jgi:hypothetical protein